ncbi:hypothetical protein E3N88_22680 [Mikania micrantha]|uniref:Uncharacterized protein n=1 Tax=Mikania micrantha TaxID=192012 RepID=A0A5N6NC78_9ASTR|nr:hypothetical protein E3N88_22680 [Mikania micrantha]
MFIQLNESSRPQASSWIRRSLLGEVIFTTKQSPIHAGRGRKPHPIQENCIAWDVEVFGTIATEYGSIIAAAKNFDEETDISEIVEQCHSNSNCEDEPEDGELWQNQKEDERVIDRDD